MATKKLNFMQAFCEQKNGLDTTDPHEWKKLYNENGYIIKWCRECGAVFQILPADPMKARVRLPQIVKSSDLGCGE